MGSSPTATLTYGYDVTDHTGDWDEDGDAETGAAKILAEAGLPDNIGIWQDYDHCHMRLTASTLVASGWRDRGEAESLELPDDTGAQLLRAAELLGIDLGDARSGWVLIGEFN